MAGIEPTGASYKIKPGTELRPVWVSEHLPGNPPKKRLISKKKQKAIGSGIQKLVRQWKATGKMETSRATYHPKSKKEAIAQAAAIEYGKHGVGRAGKTKTKKE